jgi:hypothetical protein
LKLKLLTCCLTFAAFLSAEQPLNNLRVMDLVRAGVTDSEIQTLINTAPRVDFFLTPAATDQLLKAEYRKTQSRQWRGDRRE